jgi:hypothetical protein
MRDTDVEYVVSTIKHTIHVNRARVYVTNMAS